MKKDIRLCSLPTKDLKYGAKPSNIKTESLQRLLTDIKERGIVEPLLVINLPGKYNVKVGNSRLWCAKELEIEDIKCIVVTLERHLGQVDIPKGEELDANNIRTYFKYPIAWIERINYVALKCTHVHLGEKIVK